VDFDIEKLRDQKLRYLFKERYDFRANLIDWDYNAHVIPVAPIVHFYYYKEWRLNGLAFEQRFSTYAQPNRTLASYAEGKRKDSRTTCLVRGYWGDIVISPYISFGVRCDYPQKDLLFKKANYKYIGHCVEISIYNMMYWLKRLEEDK
jgi:dynein assembly factor 3